MPSGTSPANSINPRAKTAVVAGVNVPRQPRIPIEPPLLTCRASKAQSTTTYPPPSSLATPIPLSSNTFISMHQGSEAVESLTVDHGARVTPASDGTYKGFGEEMSSHSLPNLRTVSASSVLGTEGSHDVEDGGRLATSGAQHRIYVGARL
ncbi:hypothetical protein B0H19DRAFT_1256692 [Mycena capillaripes]|nr:hypothetical protein B0H19DRAFT_1256692 [Mycena capillaripes]